MESGANIDAGKKKIILFDATFLKDSALLSAVSQNHL